MNRVLIKHIILTLMTAALFLVNGNAFAQSDGLFVIKVRQSDHYLAHVKVGGQYVVQDTTAFSPSCLWYSGIEQNISGTNHNYYFIDENGKYRYLTTLMGKNKTPGLSDDLPMTYLLSNTDTIYYFYDWDPEIKISGEGEGGGVARGHQYTEFNAQTPCEDCGHSWGDSQCWDVFWLVYKDGSGWKTPGASYYDIDDVPPSEGIGGRFHKVTVTNHPKEIDTVSSGALANLDNWAPTAVGNKSYSVTASSFTYNYIPEYNQYAFREMQINGNDSTFHDSTYYFAGNTLVTTPPPAQQTATDVDPSSYQWTITGDAAQFLSFASSGTLQHTVSGDITGSSQTLSQTLYYVQENQTGDKTAVLKLVVTYEDGSTQERTATVTLATSCQNPPEAAAPIVSHDDVLVTWYNIASKYQLQWKKTASSTWSDPVEVVPSDPAAPTVSYPIIDLEHDTEYTYRVTAYCNGGYVDPPASTGTFTTREEHELLVYGAVFGGGRMADVKGRTEVVVINCDSIGAVYGGNDIAGAVRDSSMVALGVNATGTYSSYGTTTAPIRVGDVYGGGNGYYCYGSNSFTPIGTTQTTVSIAASSTTPPAANACVLGFSKLTNEWNDTVWVNTGSTAATLYVPSISKTSIVVANDYVKVDSLFGGAKNAFVTYNNANHNADSIIIDGGTIMAVFGGNNVGGSQGAGKHFVKVNHTTTNLQGSIVNTATTGYGLDFGIRYLFGGGNKVTASTTDVVINGGQLDTIFAGGNSADVAGANITVNCPFGTMVGDYTFGNVYSNAIDPSVYTGSFSGDCIKDSYSWNGLGGIYNVRTLFGGNNHADMSVLPTLNLTSGSVGTVYGGGNAGDMKAEIESYNTALAADFGPIYTSHDPVETSPINISTHVVLSSANMLVDYLYGGCQMSNVYRGTWVEMTDGHVGTVYGGCNISGDVGSQYLFSDAYSYRPRHLRYQAVRGATYVKVSGGHVYNDLFAGSNGRYHCNNGKVYIEGIDFDDIDAEGRYLGMSIPTHNETHVYVSGGEIGGSVYAGGNLACVGFINETQPESFYTPVFVGLATVRMDGGHVYGNVFGGGNMASIWGSNAVAVQGGIIDGALYGGNDRIGLVAQITNRVLPPDYGFASDTYTSLADVRTYVSLTGRPVVNTVYGGGNGDYDDYATGQYCNPNDQPVQSNTFVDVNIDGYADGTTQGGHIGTVYGGGNGVTVTGTTVVFLNVKGEGGGEPTAYDHVGTIFGGNNKGPLAIVPEIILLKGQVNTVYGGCNQGAMLGAKSFAFGGDTYHNIGSMVHLLNEYQASETAPTVVPTAKVSNAVYGGCRMNGVTNNSLVLVEGGTFGDTVGFFGGSDISGIIGGTSRVVVKEGTHNNGPVIGNAFGGGNGNYDYVGHNVYVAGSDHTDPNNLITTSEANLTRPACEYTQIDMMGGTAGNLYGGGNAAGVSHTSTVNMNGGNVTAGIYGGCCSMDTIHGDVAINVLGGIVGTDATDRADIFGGGYGKRTRTDGNVIVNISRATGDNPPEAPTIYGDIYGGSALGHVNDTMTTTHTTTVNILNGSITGDVYGGGLGQYTDNQHDSIAALVNGKVYVNIGAKNGNAYSGNITFNTYGTDGNQGGNVFGCNNIFGTPLDSVFVNVYQTAHTGDPDATSPYTDLGNYSPTVPTNHPTVEWLEGLPEARGNFAIQSVYGGGNKASYMPPLAAGKPRAATVHVYQCLNTINDVYGGGNAADVGTTGTDAVATNTFVIVDGGRINRVFGGGNGEVTPANIYGTSTNTVNGGLVNQVFGCGNMQGSITHTNLNLTNTGDCTVEVFGEVFGGANQATFDGDLTTTIACGVGNIGSVYGGSNLADINGDVTLTIQGGDYKEVYGGSKGMAGKAADIDGTVTLNLVGGTIIQAFGGSNVNGNITGLITVNVDTIAGSCPLVLDTLFGSGNLTPYTPNQVGGQIITSPIVNVMNGTVRQAVFGSGKGATAIVTANPQVNIGDTDDLVRRLAQVGYKDNENHIHGGDVYGGGFEGPVQGGPVVNIRKSNTLVYHQVFGAGNQAGADSTVVNILDGMVGHSVYGGCNETGTVTGDIEVNIMNDLGASGSDAYNVNVFGGGLGASTATNGNVTVNIGDTYIAPVLYGEVYGGSALGKVNAADKTTTINFAKGTLYGKLYGGGLGQASPEIAALVNGDVVVNLGKDKNGTTVEGSRIYGSVFGANNVKGTPKGNVTVNLFQGVVDSIFGGGNQADYVPTDASISYPAINVSSGEVIYKVVGGGNAAGVTANPHVNISGGKICTIPTGLKAGIYGGCNTTGTVNGNIVMTITSPKPTDANAADTTVIGTLSAIQYALSHNSLQAVSVHGGGYGANTATTGNVSVTFGVDNGSDDAECRYPKLYGDLYGGSALGSVNSDGDDVTMVKVLNGSLKFLPAALDNICGGSIYGGGLGDASHAATVNGKVNVFIGALENGYRRGKAYLKGCDVFGCNNVNGSPQDDVYVHVYQTAHEEIDSVHYNDGTDMGAVRYYAIRSVYGGGNRSHYAPTGNSSTYEKKVHNYVHDCDNTVQNVYGGGNASDTDGTVVTVDGGRFKYIFGGGNGQVTPANILGGHVDITVYGGTVNWYFMGCNLHGTIGEGNTEHFGCSGDDCPCPDAYVVNNYYFGANEALTLEGLDHEINCGDNMDFRNVYAGSRLAVVYGDIKLTVRGGNITNLFGGSEGSASVIADVRKYPMDTTSIPDSLIDLRLYMRDSLTHGHDIRGKGGNIRLILEGGTIKNVYGGNNENGNVEGEITIIVDSTQAHPCELDIDYIYSGNKHANYTPDSIVVGGNKVLPVSPALYVKNGHVNYDVFGGSQGGEASLATSVGLVKSKPYVVIGDNDPSHKVMIGRHIYGGGSEANVIGDPSVVLQGNATIGGNVFGGGEHGDITGSTQVAIAPTESVSTPPTPAPSSQTLTIESVPDMGGNISVSVTSGGDPVSSGAQINPGVQLSISKTVNPGYEFSNWSAYNANFNSDSTGIVKGSGVAKLMANFMPKQTLSYEVTPQGAGTVTVTVQSSGATVGSGTGVTAGTVLSIEATANSGYRFDRWIVTGNGTIGYETQANTTFTMGTGNVTLKATYSTQ